MVCFCGHGKDDHFASGSCRRLCPCGQFGDSRDYTKLTAWMRKLARHGRFNDRIFPLTPYTAEEIHEIVHGKRKFDYQLGRA